MVWLMPTSYSFHAMTIAPGQHLVFFRCNKIPSALAFIPATMTHWHSNYQLKTTQTARQLHFPFSPLPLTGASVEVQPCVASGMIPYTLMSEPPPCPRTRQPPRHPMGNNTCYTPIGGPHEKHWANGVKPTQTDVKQKGGLKKKNKSRR